MTDKERIEELENKLQNVRDDEFEQRGDKLYWKNYALKLEREQNQKAVEALARVKELLNNEEFMVFRTPEMVIDNLIKEYGGKQC